MESYSAIYGFYVIIVGASNWNKGERQTTHYMG